MECHITADDRVNGSKYLKVIEEKVAPQQPSVGQSFKVDLDESSLAHRIADRVEEQSWPQGC